MRPFATLFTMMCYLLVSAGLSAQDPVSRANKLYNQNERDSALQVIEKHFPDYVKRGVWDSAVALQRVKAVVYLAERGFEPALAEFDKAEALAEKHLDPDSPEYLATILKKGSALLQKHDYENAERYFRRAIRGAEAGPDSTGIAARGYSELAWMFHDRKKYELSLSHARLALSKTHAAAKLDSFALLQCHRILGLTFEHLAQIDSTKKHKLRAYELMYALYPAGHVNRGIAELDMMGYYFEVQDMALAMRHVKRAEEIFTINARKNGQGRYLAVALMNIGLIYSSLGEKGLSLDYQQKAISLYEKDFGSHNPMFVESWCSLAELLMARGEFDEAQSLLDRSLRVLEDNPPYDPERYQYVNSYYSKLYLEQGKLAEALEMARQLYAFYEKKGELYSKRGVNVCSRLASIHELLGHYDTALSFAEEALQITDSIAPYDSPVALGLLNRILSISQAAGLDERFAQASDEVLKRRCRGPEKPRLDRCLPAHELVEYAGLVAGKLAEDFHENPESLAQYLKHIRHFELYYNQHLSAVRSNQTIGVHAGILKKIYGPGIRYFADAHPEKALVFSEKTKALLTRIILQSQLINEGTRGEAIQLELNKTLAALVDSDSDSLYLRAGALTEALSRYKDSLYQADPEAFIRAYGSPDFDASDILAQCKEGEVLLQYTVLDSQLYIAGHNGRKYFSESADMRRVNELLKRRSSADLEALYGLLIPQEAREAESLFIIPDGVLFHFNFEQLIGLGQKYLLELHTIRYAYSAIVHDYQHKMGNSGRHYERDLVSITPGFSDVLKNIYLDSLQPEVVDSGFLYYVQQPFLTQLAEKLKGIFNSRAFVGPEATERVVKSGISGARMLHIGTHGIIDDNSPLFSRLVFSKDSSEDGYLHTYEIYAQQFDAALAVLSACESGTGTLSSGEGVVSLAHAFTHAGCPSVLMSLWKIDESSSAEILEKFYVHLRQGYSKSEALRQAKLDYIEEVPPELRSPYYWAGLVIIGDDSPVVTGMPGLVKLIPAALLALALIAFAGWRSRAQRRQI